MSDAAIFKRARQERRAPHSLRHSRHLRRGTNDLECDPHAQRPWEGERRDGDGSISLLINPVVSLSDFSTSCVKQSGHYPVRVAHRSCPLQRNECIGHTVVKAVRIEMIGEDADTPSLTIVKTTLLHEINNC